MENCTDQLERMDTRKPFCALENWKSVLIVWAFEQSLTLGHRTASVPTLASNLCQPVLSSVDWVDYRDIRHAVTEHVCLEIPRQWTFSVTRRNKAFNNNAAG